jgi:uncharacterized sulfatase
MKTPTCAYLFAGLVLALEPIAEARSDDAPAGPRPNILWISSEDHGPHLGCYGDTYATTPNVDRLAARGMIYLHAWSCAPVCAPARTTIISGIYPPSTGAEQMRSLVAYPQGQKMFPQLLREAGYYCTNNAKEDYNLARPGQVWDVSSNKGHWKNRQPGQPFFAVFNSLKSHESQIRTRPHKQVHDPARVRVPAYHPDTPEVRQDWAQYYDKVSEADADAGRLLAELEKDGLAGDTIVFYWADHGPGMPRCKRTPCDSGLHVPLVVHIPEKFKHLAPPDYKPGGKSERLVSFVDFAPTMLSLAGVRPPEWLQGRAFLGKFLAPAPAFLHGFRGRMDERNDLVRSVTDGRYVYLRNYMPHLPAGQHVAYMFQTPTTRVWKKLFDEGKLNDAQSTFWKTKAPEELYDLKNDPDEVKNLAGSAEHKAVLARLRQAQQDHALAVRDIGFMPEGERFARARGSSFYAVGHDDSKYPFRRVFATAELASLLASEALPQLKQALGDEDSVVRYWGAMGILMRGQAGVNGARAELLRALKDPSADVRIAAAQALGQFGSAEDLQAALPLLVEEANWSKHDVFAVVAALNALDALGKKAALAVRDIQALPVTGAAPDPRYNPYARTLKEHITAGLGLPGPKE